MEHEPHAKASEDKDKFPNFKSEGLLLAWVPIAAYFTAYAFETGYCNEFGIPLFLVTVDSGCIFICAIYTIIFTTILLFLIKASPLASPKTNNKSLLHYAVLMSLGACLATVSYGLFEAELVWGFAAIVFALDALNAGANTEKNPNPFYARLQGLGVLATIARAEGKYTFSRTEVLTYKLLGISFLIFVIASVIGSGAAIQNKIYYVYSKDPSLLLITMRDGKGICARYNPETRQVLRKFVIFPISESGETEFTQTKLGILDFGQNR